MPKIHDMDRTMADVEESTRSSALSKEAELATHAGLQSGDMRHGAMVGTKSQSSHLFETPVRLLIGIGAFVLLFAVGIYAWWANSSALLGAPANPSATANVAAAHANNAQQMEDMADKLARKLSTSPGDVEGWVTLGRTYLALGKVEEAVKAQRKVVELDPKNAHAYADLADSLAIANGRNLEGEPEIALARALVLDPHHVKALALSGTLARNKGQIEEAARVWEHALKGAQPGSPMANQLQRAIAQAHAYVATASSTARVPSTPATSANLRGASISGRVVLSDALQSKVSPEDVVFVYARSIREGALPLAVVRKQVRDLPFSFVLDDSTAMNPESRLSLAREAKIGARISKTGSAKPQGGDFHGGELGMVPVGAKGVTIEINAIIR
jgi:cytochrome c-type biogenesis protein CcmH